MVDTIFIDLDGVLRHWHGNEIEHAELLVGVDKGTLFSVAFSDVVLLPAIEGRITHEMWVSNVTDVLANRYSNIVAFELISGWNSASWKIDTELLEAVKIAAPHCKLVLVTNATTKLQSDLLSAGLQSEFDVIVNSAVIGSAKPNLAFYQSALDMAGTTATKSLFIDDSPENVEVAASLGMVSIKHFKNTETIDFIRRKCER